MEIYKLDFNIACILLIGSWCTWLIHCFLKFSFQCQNLKIVPADQLLKWRFDTWVTIMATLSSLGLLTSICLTFFLACKLCTQVLEASQTTSFLLLFAIMFAYICFIPYGMYILGLSSVHMLHTYNLEFIVFNLIFKDFCLIISQIRNLALFMLLS